MSNYQYDWTKFNCKINIKAPLPVIYDAWTIPERLEMWFLRSAKFFRTKDNVREMNTHIQRGDTYEWLWHGHADDVIEKGEVLEANGENKLQFSFAGGALVTVDIGEAFGENIVMLTQEKIPVTEEAKVKYHMGCMTGWTFYLANLKSMLESGIDLRNKNMQLTQLINS